MKRKLFCLVVAAAAASVSPELLAGGFGINEQSASTMGTAFAGRASSAIDAATVYGNPAGMSRLDRPQVSGGFAVLKATSDIKNASGAFGGTNDGDMIPLLEIPFGYYVQPINDRWHFGFGMYSPYGLETSYEKTFQGRYFGRTSKVRIISLQPTVSYRFNDQFAIGVGLSYNRIDGKLSRSIVSPFTPGTNDIYAQVKGDDYTYGYNIGVLWSPTDSTRFGLTYHSKLKYTLRGHTRVGLSANSGLRYDATLSITLPEKLELAATHDFNDHWTLQAGATLTRWNRLGELKVVNDGGPTSIEPLQWKNSVLYAIGVAYHMNRQWTFRGGLAYDPTPIPDATRSVRVPSEDRRLFTAGVAWTPVSAFTADIGGFYIIESNARLSQTDGVATYSATYKNRIYGLATQLTYRF